MDKNQAQLQIREIFQNPFQRENYQHFLRNLLNEIEVRDTHYSGNLIPDAFRDHVTQYWRIGKYIDSDRVELDLLVVEVKSLSKLERARSALRNFAVNRLKQFEKDCSLVAFYTREDGGADWRFSFVKIEHEAYRDDKGKVKLKTELTPARRYSYLVGKYEDSHTVCQQLLPLLAMDYASPRIEDIEAAFAIEKVTEEFFEQYKALFTKLVETLKGQELFREEAEEKTALDVTRFSKKLLGQIVFLYFLQKKGWLGVAKDAAWGSGPKRFLRERFDQIVSNIGNYYQDFLQYLFYEALAKERKDQPDPDFYPRFDCKIPFLNGGLFESDYDWKKHVIDLPNSLFRNQEKNKAGDVGTGILDVFDRYNFTIKEDEPLEKEVAVDPEMLGKVFENMLEITERKSKGAFYTPREIVHYMCLESMIHYLDNGLNNYSSSYQALGDNQPDMFGGTADEKGNVNLEARQQDGILVPKDDIEILVRIGHLALENDQRVLDKGKETDTYKFQLPETVRKNAKLIDRELANIKVCDPAVGSGAFPVGLLHEIVNARLALAPHTGNTPSTYELKRHTIRESIYGVDIDASAIDVARLRLWLSLIVDEDDYSATEALPNLDYKIVRGNSLIGFPENVPYNSDIEIQLEDLKSQFFSESSETKKKSLRRKIDATINELIQSAEQLSGYEIDFDFKLFFSEAWHKRNGFDVVIGNPPYVSHDKIDRQTKLVLKEEFVSFAPFADLYCYFVEQAMKLQARSGLLTFITSNSYLRADYGYPIRQELSNRNEIIEIINIDDYQVFSTAIVNSSILISSNEKRSRLARIVNETFTGQHSFVSFILQHTQQYRQEDFDRRTWNLIRPEDLSLLQKIAAGKPTLNELKAKIRLGIATGANDILIISSEKRDEFLRQSSKNGEILKPILRGRDIQRYYYDLPGDYIILSKNGIDVPGDFPDIYEYLDSSGQSFKRRGAQGQHWTNLRACAFFDDFKEEKIVWIELTDRGRFAISREEVYLLNSAYFMLPPPTIEPRYLLGILNSSVIYFYLVPERKVRFFRNY